MTSLVYLDGTASVSTGSALVTGHGTAWKIALVEGGSFSLAGLSVPILSVDSDTSLTLAYDWPGDTLEEARYAIARETSQAIRAAWINDRLAQFHQKPWGIGVLPDGRGTLAERNALNPMPFDNYCWLRVEVDQPAELYFKVPAGWLGPFRLSGEVGPVGPAGVLRWRTEGWNNTASYQVNDGLAHNGTSYRAYVAHEASPATQPGVGANWQSVWQVTAQGTILIEGTTTTLPPDQPARVEFEPAPGGYVVNFFVPRGATGDIGGLTSYWQERVTSDSTHAQAQAGLGGTVVGRALFTAADAASARNTADVYSKAEAGALSEMRNKIINPLFAINQRSVSGTVTLTAGKYGHDRFKAGASGCTYTFATSNGVTTITITAGSLIQTIEAAAFAGASGTYVLSWTGTAQGRINAAAYGASGRTAAVTGSANVNVEWSAGTLSRPQFELEYTSRFTPRHIQQEYALCQRYFQICTILPGAYYNTTVATVAAILPVQMRVTPTVTLLPGAKLLEPGIANRDILSVSGALTSGIGGQVDVTTAAITNIKPVCFVRDGSLSFDAEL